MSRRRKGNTKTQLIKIIICLLILVVSKLGVYDNISTNKKNDSKIPSIVPAESYEVIRVIDGDTMILQIDGKNTRLRLIGIDTPESVSPKEDRNTLEGKEVSQFTKETLEGKRVKLEFDKESKDKYGRSLAYLYLDDKMFNKILLEKGYARVINAYPNVKYEDEFRDIQGKAKNNNLGFWALDESPWK